MAALKPLSYGMASFEVIRESNAIYVDKTAFISSFLTFRTPVFISRPRRFGKSLLCSTLKSFFTHGIEYFRGLYLEQWWYEQSDEVRQSLSGKTVLHLDFSDLDFLDFTHFKASLKDSVCGAIAAVCADFQVPGQCDACRALRNFLTARPAGSVVLLIDEYDCPVTYFLERLQELQLILGYLDSFYRMLREQADRLGFFFLTGVSRMPATGVFSAFSNADDLTFNGAYAALLGFTEAELHLNYDSYIQHAAQVVPADSDTVYAELKRNYDGFRFTPENELTVCAPWAVLGFLNDPHRGCVNYWYSSARLPAKFCAFIARSCELDVLHPDRRIAVSRHELESGIGFDVSDDRQTVTPAFNPAVYLFQAGYYAIRSSGQWSEQNLVTLGLSSTEITESLTETLLCVLDQALSRRETEEIGSVKDKLAAGDLPGLARIFDLCLRSWVCDSETLSSACACRNLIAAWLAAKGVRAASVTCSRSGSCGLILTLPDARLWYVLVFIVHSADQDDDRRLRESLAQLQDSITDAALPAEFTHKRAGVVIGSDFRRVTGFVGLT